MFLRYLLQLFLFSLIILNDTHAFSMSREYPKLRVIEVDVSKFKDDYNHALKSDDLEEVNRAIFSFNETVDDYFLEPVARGYRYAVPEWGRNRIGDFFNNIKEPVNFVNSILQGDVESSFRSFWRFYVNSLFGVGGIYDVAGGFGLQEKPKDFSQTLALYGVHTGDYMVLPFLGPSTYRDFIGLIFDRFSDPTTYISDGGASVAVNALEVIDMREGLLDLTDDIEFNSFDPYATFKSGYLQTRKREVLQTIE